MNRSPSLLLMLALLIPAGLHFAPSATVAQEKETQEQDARQEAAPQSQEPTAAELFQRQIDKLDLGKGDVCDRFEDLNKAYLAAVGDDNLKNAERRKIRSAATNEAFDLVDRCDDPAYSVEILSWVVEQNGRNRKGRKAVAIIESKYLDQPGIGDAFGPETGLDVLLTLIAENPDTNTVAVARFLKALRDTDEEQKENQLRLLKESHGDVPYRGKRLADHITQPLAALRFRVGKTAPNIAGPDTDNVSFELADYRGKVVVLDFWGDW